MEGSNAVEEIFKDVVSTTTNDNPDATKAKLPIFDPTTFLGKVVIYELTN